MTRTPSSPTKLTPKQKKLLGHTVADGEALFQAMMETFEDPWNVIAILSVAADKTLKELEPREDRDDLMEVWITSWRELQERWKFDA
jgi:hypothetical protein